MNKDGLNSFFILLPAWPQHGDKVEKACGNGHVQNANMTNTK